MPSKTARIEMRLTEDAKQLLETAAEIEGLPLSSFALLHLLRAAREVVDDQRTTTLSLRDGRRLIRLLESPPKPTPALKKAAKRWKKYLA